MSGGAQHDAILATEALPSETTRNPAVAVFEAVMEGAFRLSALALLAAAGVLTFGVVMGHLTGRGLLWQDEVTVFLISGAVFLSAASVQARRGHVAIDVLDHAFPYAKELRHGVVEAGILAFCLIFAWKSGMLLAEAVQEGQTSHSAWGPPLWIPYSVLTAGMALLALQMVLQVGRRSPWLLALVAAGVAAFLLATPPARPLISGLPHWVTGIAYSVVTLLVMFSGMPIAFALGVVALIFMLLFMPAASVDTIAQNFYEELANVIILAIPLFILKGATIGRSNAGKDLYSALHAWLHRIPGGLGVANTIACGLFAAMAGSSPATCSAIGSAGIPEMRARGYSPGFAAGIIAAGGTLGILLPPSVTMLLYAVAAEVSLGRLFLAGIGPGLLLITLFAGYSMVRYRHEYRRAELAAAAHGTHSALLADEHYSTGEKIRMVIWVAPFVTILAGVMVVLYAGWATPSETAGVGAVLALLVIGLMYGIWRPRLLMPILTGTLRESTMLLMIIGMSLLYAYVMSYLHISQSAADWIIGLSLSKWFLLAAILLFTMVLGFFLPPVSIILMTAPIILPPLKAAGFDLIWFGVVMTVVMEMGLIHPPVGLNIFVIKNIAPDIPLKDIIWGTIPFVLIMMAAVVLCSLFPGIATWLPSAVMN
ncbi:TRAP transporter large permease subunit [Magnetospirillum sp. 15-1]|uniref:TRAP transporter large permease n=1 Tax=Magnetospirillum sp. 15-1 TaxID=1979370 RepID=UPI000BBCB9D0|nr:TRAP transporter large permease subunit [Magnetospirillum sp. 15-1]